MYNAKSTVDLKSIIAMEYFNIFLQMKKRITFGSVMG